MSVHISASDHFWNKKIRLRYVIIILAAFILSLGAGQYVFLAPLNFHKSPVIVQSDDCPPPPVVRYRMNEYTYTHPLLLADVLSESKNLLGLKNEVNFLIEQRKNSGIIEAASVYIRTLNGADWVCINPGLELNPGSLIKVPVMMTFLRESEINPGLLSKKIVLDPARKAKVPVQTYNDGNIRAGRSYTIKELLYYMIVKSDNWATMLLNENVNVNTFKKFFTDLGLPEPDVHASDFHISAADYSKFMRVLYNATYLNNENAEYALTLLAQSDFKEGILKSLPPGIKVAHKFGEMGKANDPTNHQLHESGIIYTESPYLITIMTKGRNVQPLPQVISDISKLVYERMSVKQPKS